MKIIKIPVISALLIFGVANVANGQCGSSAFSLQSNALCNASYIDFTFNSGNVSPATVELNGTIVSNSSIIKTTGRWSVPISVGGGTQSLNILYVCLSNMAPDNVVKNFTNTAPSINSVNNIGICSGSPVGVQLSTSFPAPNLTYNWTSSVTSGSVSGNGSVLGDVGGYISEVLTGSGVVTYTVYTKLYSCQSTSKTFTVSVTPTSSTGNGISGSNTGCIGTTTTLTATGSPYNFYWQKWAVSGTQIPLDLDWVTIAGSNNQTSILFTVPDASYVNFRLVANTSCAANPTSATFSINSIHTGPALLVDLYSGVSTNQAPVCAGGGLYVTLTSETGSSLSWTASVSPPGAVTGVGSGGGTGGMGTYTLSNNLSLSTVADATIQYNFLSTKNGCTSSKSSTITIPSLYLTGVPSSAMIICSGENPDVHLTKATSGSVSYRGKIISGQVNYVNPVTDVVIGSGINITETLNNTGTVQALVRYEVTLTNGSCSRPTEYFDVYVDPVPSVGNIVLSKNSTCGPENINVSVQGNTKPVNIEYYNNTNGQWQTLSGTTYNVTENTDFRTALVTQCGTNVPPGVVSSVVFNTVPPAPDVPTVTTNTCDSKILTRGTPPTGISWYWQGQNSAGEDYLSTAANGVTYEAATTGDYYLRGKSDAGCWGPSVKRNVQIEPEYLTLDEYDPTAPIAEATVGIILGPGFVVPPGSSFTALVGISAVCEERVNWSEQILYGPGESIVGRSKGYYDAFGNVLQSQAYSVENNKFFASQPLYSSLGVAVGSTLSAPTAWDDFRYQKDFVRNEAGQKYSSVDFDNGTTTPGGIYNPKPVGDTKAYTLGWYYSANNTYEPFTATTDFPYSRSYVPDGPDPTTSISAGPGDQNKMGSGHEVSSERTKVTTGELDHYYSLRHHFTTHESYLNTDLGYKYVTTDPNGKTSTTYTDADGKDIASFADNKWSYTYYNDAGQVVATVAPNGVNTASSALPNFVTTFKYDNLGRLIETTSPDEGTSRFVYSTDGKIRFSENAEQRNATPKRFSYTNYDRLGRLIESGEYESSGTNYYEFEPHSATAPAAYSVLGVIDNIGFTGVTGNQGETRCHETNYILYDIPDSSYPTDALHIVQENMIGQVSRTKNDNSTTWYSYDEFGRLSWMKQLIVNFGFKTVDYTYDYFGNVTEVAYQKGEADAFYHHYDYDLDQRLTAVYTSLDSTNLSLKAKYEYYLHGPLKRVELGGDKQGIDYVYNIDGSLKLINHPDPAYDPGLDGISGEHSGVKPDVFGLALDYNPGDYTGAGYDEGNLSTSGYADQYGGALKAIRWHSAVDGHTPRAYAFTYDNLYQMDNAVWGNVTGSSGSYSFSPSGVNAYQEDITAYDKNGNIQGLVRKDKLGSNMANFGYNYTANTNKLNSVTDNSAALLSYQYNSIGQMTQQTEGTNTMKVSYTAYGLVKDIKDASNNLMVSFLYDDRGNRLKKTTYSGGTAQLATWYISDAAGNSLAVYEEDISISGPITLAEVPIYGAGRLAVYKPDVAVTFYEVTDHLGNVRGVIGAPETLIYTATMEDNGTALYTNPRVQELAYFKNLGATEANTNFMNHTSASTYVPAPENSAYLYWKDGVAGIEPEEKSVGPAIGLKVEPGDKLDLEAYVKYQEQAQGYNRTGITGAMASILGNGFVGSAAGIDIVSTATQVFQNGLSAVTGAMVGNGNDGNTLPYAYLYYMLYDKSFNFVTAGWSRVGDAGGGFDAGSEALSTHGTVSISDVTITEPGYVYIFVANESEDTKVWFDDLKITHERNDIVAGADFYPFGLPMETREITREDFRYDYQGQFSEKDDETGWNAFDLRMYDARIGRWISPDPYGQFASPYLGMGNAPNMNVDPDGGLTGGPGPGFVEGLWNSTMLLAEIVITPTRSFVNAGSILSSATKVGIDVAFHERVPSLTLEQYQLIYPEFLGMDGDQARAHWEAKYGSKFAMEWDRSVKVERAQLAQQKLDLWEAPFGGAFMAGGGGSSGAFKPQLRPTMRSSYKSSPRGMSLAQNADDLVVSLKKVYGGNVTVMKNGNPIFRVHQPGSHGNLRSTITRFNKNINPQTGRTFFNPAANVSPFDKSSFDILQKASRGQGGYSIVTRGGL